MYFEMKKCILLVFMEIKAGFKLEIFYEKLSTLLQRLNKK